MLFSTYQAAIDFSDIYYIILTLKVNEWKTMAAWKVTNKNLEMYRRVRDAANLTANDKASCLWYGSTQRSPDSS